MCSAATHRVARMHDTRTALVARHQQVQIHTTKHQRCVSAQLALRASRSSSIHLTRPGLQACPCCSNKQWNQRPPSSLCSQLSPCGTCPRSARAQTRRVGDREGWRGGWGGGACRVGEAEAGVRASPWQSRTCSRTTKAMNSRLSTSTVVGPLRTHTGGNVDVSESEVHTTRTKCQCTRTHGRKARAVRSRRRHGRTSSGQERHQCRSAGCHPGRRRPQAGSRRQGGALPQPCGRRCRLPHPPAGQSCRCQAASRADHRQLDLHPPGHKAQKCTRDERVQGRPARACALARVRGHACTGHMAGAAKGVRRAGGEALSPSRLVVSVPRATWHETVGWRNFFRWAFRRGPGSAVH